MTQHERERFAGLPACDECEHPTGHHTRRGCAWCACAERPEWQPDQPEAVATADPGIYATAEDYYITPAALLRMGVRPGAVAEVVQRCHDAAGLPRVADVVLRGRA